MNMKALSGAALERSLAAKLEELLVGVDWLRGWQVDRNHPTTVYDMHTTILHELGLDHPRLTYRFQGPDFRLADVHGSVVKDLFA
jgi:hypothetical protein